MPKTLGERHAAVQAAVTKALAGQSYKIADRELQRVPFSLLQKMEQDLVKKITIYGRDYVEGQNTSPTKMQASVRFS